MVATGLEQQVLSEWGREGQWFLYFSNWSVDKKPAAVQARAPMSNFSLLGTTASNTGSLQVNETSEHSPMSR